RGAAAQPGADRRARQAGVAPRQGVGRGHRPGDPGAGRPGGAHGGDPVGPARQGAAPAHARCGVHRVRAPQSDVRRPRLLRLPAVQPGQRDPGEARCATGGLEAAVSSCDALRPGRCRWLLRFCAHAENPGWTTRGFREATRGSAQPRTTLPALMQEVHTFMRLRCERPILACTVWMFGFHRRLVFRWECETELPKPGPLPQTSQTAATSDTPNFALTVTAMKPRKRVSLA